jgi:hypothetical protein
MITGATELLSGQNRQRVIIQLLFLGQGGPDIQEERVSIDYGMPPEAHSAVEAVAPSPHWLQAAVVVQSIDDALRG